MNTMRKPKRHHVVRTTISMPMPLFVKAAERQQKRGLNNFSAYVQVLLHTDQQPEETEKETA